MLKITLEYVLIMVRTNPMQGENVSKENIFVVMDYSLYNLKRQFNVLLYVLKKVLGFAGVKDLYVNLDLLIESRLE